MIHMVLNSVIHRGKPWYVRHGFVIICLVGVFGGAVIAAVHASLMY